MNLESYSRDTKEGYLPGCSFSTFFTGSVLQKAPTGWQVWSTMKSKKPAAVELFFHGRTAVANNFWIEKFAVGRNRLVARRRHQRSRRWTLLSGQSGRHDAVGIFFRYHTSIFRVSVCGNALREKKQQKTTANRRAGARDGAHRTRGDGGANTPQMTTVSSRHFNQRRQRCHTAWFFFPVFLFPSSTVTGFCLYWVSLLLAAAPLNVSTTFWHSCWPMAPPARHNPHDSIAITDRSKGNSSQ